MTAAAAVILGISLIFMGCVVIGSAMGWYEVQDSIWGWVIAVLAIVTRWVSSKAGKKGGNGNLPGALGLVLLLLAPALDGCTSLSPETRASLAVYGSCVGARAVDCAAKAEGADLEARALSFSACMAGGAILCVPVATAASNPPGSSGVGSIDLVCLHAAFKACAADPGPRACVEARAPGCGR